MVPMTKTKAPGKTPSPAGPVEHASGGDRKTKSPTMVFVTAALDMSWRLAIVVLVPIIGGFELDQRWHTEPAFLIIGFLVAGAGTAIILKQTLDQYSPVPPKASPKKEPRP